MKKLNAIGMEARERQLNVLLSAQQKDFSIEYSRSWKNNVELEGYCLRSDKRNCTPVIYYSEEWYQNPDNEVVSFLSEMYEKHSCQMDVSWFIERDHILSHILPCLVSKNNKSMLESKKIAHMGFLDMYIIFYIKVENITDGVNGSIKLTEKIMEMAGVSLDEVYEAALKNMEPLVDIVGILETISGLQDIIPQIQASDDLPPMLICTNLDRNMGAAVMLCESTIHKLEARIGKKIAILPSSIHECIAVPYEKDDIDQLSSMVKEVNHMVVSPEDRLSDSVYMIKDDKLQIVI